MLVVDDDERVAAALKRALGLEGFAVRVSLTGHGALGAVAEWRPDVVVLDVGLPDLNGRAVAARLRAAGDAVPICILSARDQVDDRVAGLQAGADDYLVKPFAVEELVARLRALLRRGVVPLREPEAPLVVADLVVDVGGRSARRGDRPLELTRREFDLLGQLARNHGLVLSRDQLLQDVWGYDFPTDGNVVDVFVSHLRKKLEAGGESRLVHTVRGVGFVLRP
ncbi:MAG: response regulator transcription factor [Solirubrobacterales bacterium]|nr:response regulator transcription factor [Solirubrobacterales bacterium]